MYMHRHRHKNAPRHSHLSLSRAFFCFCDRYNTLRLCSKLLGDRWEAVVHNAARRSIVLKQCNVNLNGMGNHQCQVQACNDTHAWICPLDETVLRLGCLKFKRLKIEIAVCVFYEWITNKWCDINLCMFRWQHILRECCQIPCITLNHVLTEIIRLLRTKTSAWSCIGRPASSAVPARWWQELPNHTRVWVWLKFFASTRLSMDYPRNLSTTGNCVGVLFNNEVHVHSIRPLLCPGRSSVTWTQVMRVSQKLPLVDNVPFCHLGWKKMFWSWCLRAKKGVTRAHVTGGFDVPSVCI